MKLFLVTLLLVLGFQGRALAHSEPIDIVFDIDWTTFYSIDPNDPSQTDKNIISVGGKYYRATDHLAEVIESLLKHPEVRISFFSGGERSRNEALLSKVALSNGKTLKDVTFRVFSKEDLTSVATDANLKFSDRYRKSLNGILPGANPGRAILIDDQIKFALAPWKAVFSLGKFNFQNEFQSVKSGQAFFPADTSEWIAEKDKALMWKALLEEALVQSQRTGRPFSEVTVELWEKKSSHTLCKNIFSI